MANKSDKKLFQVQLNNGFGDWITGVVVAVSKEEAHQLFVIRAREITKGIWSDVSGWSSETQELNMTVGVKHIEVFDHEGQF